MDSRQYCTFATMSFLFPKKIIKFLTSSFVFWFISFSCNTLKFACAENIGIPSHHINIGLLVGFNVDQAFINFTTRKYPFMRSIHNNPPTNLVPLVVLANDIAKSLNCTLRASPFFTVKDPTSLPLNSPTILFSIYLTDNQAFNHTWMHYWNQGVSVTLNSPKNLPSVVVSEAFYLNFLYCDVIHSKYESSYQLGIFTRSFDIYCWLSLVFSFCIITVYISFKAEIHHTSVISILLSTLFSLGVSGLTRATKKLTILVVWMLSCMVLSNMYLGEFSSMLVKPPEPNVLENIQQLRKNNYTLLYPTHLYYRGVRNAAIETENPFKIFRTYVVSETIKSFEDKILKFTEMITSTKSKQAFIHFWPLAFNIAGVVKSRLEKRKVKSATTCHVGKKLIPVNSLNYVILPPDNIIVLRVYQRFFDTGVYRFWQDETIGLSHSSRVQDRSKVKGPTKLVEGSLSVKSLQLKGRISKLFLLWATCLALCFTILVCELMFKWTELLTQLGVLNIQHFKFKCKYENTFC